MRTALGFFILAATSVSGASYELIDLGYSTQPRINNLGQLISANQFWENHSASAQDLPGLGGTVTRTADINERGEVAGHSTTPQEWGRAVRWESGHVQDLGFDDHSAALAINNRGDLLVDSNGHAFIWSDGRAEGIGVNDGVWDLNNLGRVGGNNGIWHDGAWHNIGSPVYALNDSGQAVGNSGLWTGSQWIDIGGVGYELNALGQVVGASFDTQGNGTAILYEQGVTYDLNALVTGESWFHLTRATDINDQGQIVGIGFLNEGDFFTRGFLLTPIPEPATLWMFTILIGLGETATRRRVRGRWPAGVN